MELATGRHAWLVFPAAGALAFFAWPTPVALLAAAVAIAALLPYRVWIAGVVHAAAIGVGMLACAIVLQLRDVEGGLAVIALVVSAMIVYRLAFGDPERRAADLAMLTGLLGVRIAPMAGAALILAAIDWHVERLRKYGEPIPEAIAQRERAPAVRASPGAGGASSTTTSIRRFFARSAPTG